MEKTTHGVTAAGSESAGCRVPDGITPDFNDLLTVIIGYAELGLEQLEPGTSLHHDVGAILHAGTQLQQSFGQLRALAARLQTVRDEERQRVAREIHDQLGQALTAIKIDMHSLIYKQQREAESLFALIDQTMESVRRISTDLRPAVLDDLGLMEAIEWATQEFQSRTGTKVHLNLPQDDVVVDRELSTALFRILQETLTNVARHANATHVAVRLTREGGSLAMEVHDNGKGISGGQVTAGSSLGILGMRERASMLGGEFSISGAPGEGTSIRVRIPEPPPSETA